MSSFLRISPTQVPPTKKLQAGRMSVSGADGHSGKRPLSLETESAVSQDGRGFVTGSRAYGFPREDSDLDLVVEISPDSLTLLVAFAGQEASHYADGTVSVKIGGLNLLCCTSREAFEVWQRGTDQLMSERPVPRERAVEVLSALEVSTGLVR